MEEIGTYLEQLRPVLTEYIARLVIGLVILVVGLKLVNRLSRSLRKTIMRSGINEEVSPFIVSFLSVLLKLLLVFTVAAIFGIDVTSFIAVMAAAGFAVGLALQGSLSNFAAGILILLFRHYRVGDWVEIGDKFGKVEEIQIFNSLITSPGQKTLIIPNSRIIEDTVTNYSVKGFFRMELNVSMPYEESFPKVYDIIMAELQLMENIMKDPLPEVGIESYDSHNVLIAVRPYIDPDHYWEVTFEVYARIKRAFHEHGIHMAYSEGVELGLIGQ